MPVCSAFPGLCGINPLIVHDRNLRKLRFAEGDRRAKAACKIDVPTFCHTAGTQHQKSIFIQTPQQPTNIVVIKTTVSMSSICLPKGPANGRMVYDSCIGQL